MSPSNPPIQRSAGVPILGLAALLLWPAVSGHAASASRRGSVRKDTAGTHLMSVWKLARRKHGDALLFSITGNTDKQGVPICSPQAPFQDGWRYSFFSPKNNAFLMAAACRGRIVGPLRQIRGKRKDVMKEIIRGKFIDSDQAMRALVRAGIPLDPKRYGATGRRPYQLKLQRVKHKELTEFPTVWRVRVGKRVFYVDAVYNEVFSPARYGVRTVHTSTPAARAKSLGRAPKEDAYTVKTDFDEVLRYAQRKLPRSSLMAVEGFVDAWGGSQCTGRGDGWAFYYYNMDSGTFEVIYSCKGFIGPGPTRYIPVDLKFHKPLDLPFVDSNDVVDNLLDKHPDSMNEGLGRRHTRHGILLLRNHKKSPLSAAGMPHVTMIWRLTLGRSHYRFDARSGRFLDVQE